MSAPDLRPYQSDVIDKFHDAVAAGKRRIILVAPTGSGKTIIGADIINTTTRAQKRVLVLAHRREIIQQTAAKLSMNRVYPGIIMAGVQPRPLELAQLASVQTLWVRSQHTGRMDLPPADSAGRSMSATTPRRRPTGRSSRPIPTRCCSASRPRHAAATGAGSAASSRR